ncbi:MAG TPA: hypothetical protein VFW62_11050 [bacterium]|nr:hypothetical protein [bacterium]
MQFLKPWAKSLLGFILALGFTMIGAGDALAGGKGAWAILTDPQVRWVDYPGSEGKLIYDRETGLIWEQAPGAFIPDDWFEAAGYCLHRNYLVNGKPVYGFRLPSAPELTNLSRDIFTAFSGVQQSTHVLGIQFDNYYVSGDLVRVERDESSVLDPSSAFWGVAFTFNNGPVFPTAVPLATQGPAQVGDSQLGHAYRVMCVRGGGGNNSGHATSRF